MFTVSVYDCENVLTKRAEFSVSGVNPPSWNVVRHQYEKTLGAAFRGVCYKDEEGDMIRVDSEEEWIEAVRVAARCDESGRRNIELNLFRSEEKPVKAAAAPAKADAPATDSSSPATVMQESLQMTELRDSIVEGVLKGLEGAVITSVMSGGQSAAPKPSDGVKYHHLNVVCDGCEKSIVGARFKCGNCADFDLCETCEAKGCFHRDDHVFIKLNKPVLRCGMTEEGTMVPLLPCLVTEQVPLLKPAHKHKKTEEEKALKRKKKEEEKACKKKEEEKACKKKEEEKACKKKEGEDKVARRLAKAAEKQAKLVARNMNAKAPVFETEAAEPFSKYQSEIIVDGQTLPPKTPVRPGSIVKYRWLVPDFGYSALGMTLHCIGGTLTPVQTEVPIPPVRRGESTWVEVQLRIPFAGNHESLWALRVNGIRVGNVLHCKLRAFDLAGYNSRFVGDLNFPDETVVHGGSVILKRWQIENNGQAKWCKGVQLHCVRGTMKAVLKNIPVPSAKPGEKVTVQAEIAVPEAPGRYDSVWVLMCDGVPFGSQMWCDVVVVESPKLAVQPASSGHCYSSVLLLSDNVPEHVQARQTITRRWCIGNTGTKVWDNVILMCVDPHDHVQVPVPALAPGQYCEVEAPVTAPAQSGEFLSRWVLGRLGSPFGHILHCPLLVQCPSECAIAVASAPEAAVEVKQTKTWSPPAKTWSSKYLDEAGTITDGAKVKPGAVVRKSWRFLNNGSKAWCKEVAFTCISGNIPCPQSKSRVVHDTVQPGEEYTLSKIFIAPTEPGSYRSTWVFKHNDLPFGDIVWCDINVIAEEEDETPKQPWSPPAKVFSSKFIDDAGTISEGTRVLPGSAICKSWLFENNGQKEWDSEVAFTCVKRDEILCPDGLKVAIEGTVAPGEKRILSRTFTAPTIPGTYRSTWVLKHNDLPFGDIVWCDIRVVHPPPSSPVPVDDISHTYDVVAPTEVPSSSSPAAAEASASSGSSESDEFIIVPMPDCFNLDVPNEMLASAKSLLEKSTASVDLMTFSHENPSHENPTEDDPSPSPASETQLTDLVHATGGASPVNEATPLLAVAEEDEDNEVEEDYQDAPDQPSQPAVQLPQLPQENPLVQLPGQTLPTLPPIQRQPYVLPQQQWVPKQPTTPMEHLFDMGFYDRKLNQQLLTKYNNDVQTVVAALIGMQNSGFP